jgi:colicin import membrane protein
MAIHIRTLALALALGAGLFGCAAQELAQEPAPVPASSSVQEADAKLAEAAILRASVETRFSEREQVCYTKFFVNHCLDKAREERRAALFGLRPIEIEASRFKRAHAVEQRDLALAADNAKTAPPVAPAQKAESAPPAAPKLRAPRQPQPVAVNDDAKRAANVAAYEKRRKASLQRQREIAVKQAEREAAEAAKKP